jgi:hypothetical protein
MEGNREVYWKGYKRAIVARLNPLQGVSSGTAKNQENLQTFRQEREPGASTLPTVHTVQPRLLKCSGRVLWPSVTIVIMLVCGLPLCFLT